MSQCVPNWDVEDAVPGRFDLRPHPSTSTSTSSALDVPMLDYEMAELTWENGQLSMHGIGLRRLSGKPNICSSPEAKVKYAAWERPRAATGTLESIVDLATQKPPPPAQSSSDCDDVDLVPCFGGRSSNTEHHQASGAAAATMDALVPCQIAARDRAGCSTGVGSCSGAGAATGDPTRVGEDGDERSVRKKAGSAPRVPVAGKWSNDQSASVSGTFAGDSWHVPTVDTCERDLGGVDFTSTSFCSQGNTLSSSGRPCTNTTTTVDDHDSVCHSRPQRETGGSEEERKKGNAKSSSSNRRSRAAAIHNQSERKRRDKINQKMKTLQKLVPNSNKTDKASMLDEVIDYLKQLQAQVHMMSRMSIPSMISMMPQLAIQQQLQMSMMAAAAASPMGMGMGFGMGMGMGMGMPMPMPASLGMDMNMNIPTMARRNLPQPVLNPAAAFMPLAAAAWDVSNAAPHDRFPPQPPPATAIVPTDPISTYLACQPQPVTVEAYSRMIALIQQQQQQLTSTSKH